MMLVYKIIFFPVFLLGMLWGLTVIAFRTGVQDAASLFTGAS